MYEAVISAMRDIEDDIDGGIASLQQILTF